MIFGLVAATSGCHTARHAFLVNATDAALQVSVSMPIASNDFDGRLHVCRIDRSWQPMMVGPLEQVNNRQLRGWLPVPLGQYDYGACSASFTLPPGLAVLMYSDGSCSNYREIHSDSRYRATIDRLKITGSGLPILLTGFDTAEAFKVSGWHHDCKLVVR